ncbi:precorrin-2 C(20)-methyltransferase [Celerinatantimonas sp. YJH-8]|uniref:precorrin-2 C(20)-methyltransferase n=1 Tax=Celerinatantimonas sp. YJH-8 TaxID=3228714 RepID=UPI0038C646D7
MTETAWGSLYALGVGPGDPELLTLKALRILTQVDVIAVPEKTQGSQSSFAWSIAAAALAEQPISGRVEFLYFPMTHHSEANQRAWDDAAATVAGWLRQGLSVAFLTEGDPSVFSTWGYLHAELHLIEPAINATIVPGVSSINAVAAQTQIPLGDGQERFCVVPALYGLEHLESLMKAFDTIVLMKAGRSVPALRERLQRLGLEHAATLVCHASCQAQQIYHDLAQAPQQLPYFSTIQLSLRHRAGILAGKVRASG